MQGGGADQPSCSAQHADAKPSSGADSRSTTVQPLSNSPTLAPVPLANSMQTIPSIATVAVDSPTRLPTITIKRSPTVNAASQSPSSISRPKVHTKASTSLHIKIPKKNKLQKLPTQSDPPLDKGQKRSERSGGESNPMKVRLKLSLAKKKAPQPVPSEAGHSSTASRKSSRTPKRKHSSYVSYDLDDTDSDISAEEVWDRSRSRKIAKKASLLKRKQPPPTRGISKVRYFEHTDESEFLETLPLADTVPVVADPNLVESPPSGVLPSLWYSRECVLHIWVVDKVIGWKTRPVTSLKYLSDDKKGEDVKLDPDEARKCSAAVVKNTINYARKRMETSRINPTKCPEVLKVIAEKEKRRATSSNVMPGYIFHTSSEDREQVVLVKWRGKSYLHCSWERVGDLERFDTAKATAKTKIKKYFQNREVVLGQQWKQVLEQEREAFHKEVHHHGFHKNEYEREDKFAPTEEEDFFPPDYMEVERILACDENEMNMDIFPKQRALNAIVSEKEALLLEKCGAGASGRSTPALAEPESENESWDPEDYVRYVVKYKGLPLAELSWEYWLNLKYDCVDEAENFWLRQRAPSLEEAKKIANMHHPHARGFRKLKESPIFGRSQRKHSIAPHPNEGLLQAASKTEEDDPERKGLKLRGYQLEGVNWLLWNWWNRRSCILADEMGLGKTIQSLAFLDQLMRHPEVQVRGPFLIVAPLSLVSQWRSEAETWVPHLNVILYHGSADARDFLAKQEFFYTDQFASKSTTTKLKRLHICKVHIVVTTYEVVMKDISFLSRIRWKALIVDEAHRLKNAKSRLFDELGGVPRDFCLLLTGTPLQNSTDELWALLNFADPISFASKEAFIEKFGQLTDAQQVSDLHTVLKPYLLRRVKEDVEKSLPPKEETILEVSLTPIQKTYYKAIYDKNTTFLFKGVKTKNTPSLMNIVMELRKCCNHPFLIGGAEERILADAVAIASKPDAPRNQDNQDVETAGQGGALAPSIDYRTVSFEQLVKSSGKMVILSKLLPKLKEGGHRVLIFSQMVRVLDLLEDFLRWQEHKFERLDGSKTAFSRTAAVDRFTRKNSDRFVMLLSTRAGGLGLNLTSADTVIIYDSDWNPQNDLQAMARAHRIGQTRAVRVYRLLTSKTYEMHMFHSASMKLGLDRAVLAQQRANEGSSKSARLEQVKEIDNLLKKGAYDVFRDDDDNEAQAFLEETDIDKLLERSSRQVTYGKDTSALNSGLGSFSKASFVASGEGDGKDVDLDDPDFWEKAVGLQTPVNDGADESLELLTDGKRSRKQVKQYDPYADERAAEEKRNKLVAEKLEDEKLDKERIKLEKKLRREAEKEQRRREREVTKYQDELGKEGRKAKQSLRATYCEHRPSKEGKSKKARKAERQKALRRAAREDPVPERIKQAWEVSHRNRATSAALRFGFGRFSKIRQESNLTSLPLQDLEVFVRAYLYQIGLQAAVSMAQHQRSTPNDKDVFPSLAKSIYSIYGSRDGNWICDAIESSLSMLSEVQTRKRYLRLPIVLADPEYVSELRAGAALRALRRFAFLSRLNAVVEKALDDILFGLCYEELGKRGCAANTDLSSLDVDLKARHVSTEELSHAIGVYLETCCSSLPITTSVAPWWDHSCDSGLIIGTFIHGLGNYEAMRNDDELPFSRRIVQFVSSDPGSVQAHLCFQAATKFTKAAYVDALKTAKLRAQIDEYEAVAAVIAAKQNGVAKSSDKGGVDPSAPGKSYASLDDGRAAILGNDDNTKLDYSDKVTLHRLSQSIIDGIREKSSMLKKHQRSKFTCPSFFSLDKKELGCQPHRCLPMPDAIYLDQYLVDLLDMMEGGLPERNESNSSGPSTSFQAQDNEFVRVAVFNNDTARKTIGTTVRSAIVESFRGTFCGSYHRSLSDHSDYSLGAASPDLASLAVGADANRYKRGPCVPLYITRYSVCALAHADTTVIDDSCRAKLKEDSSDQSSIASVPAEAILNKKTDTREEIDKPESLKNHSTDDDDTIKPNPGPTMDVLNPNGGANPTPDIARKDESEGGARASSQPYGSIHELVKDSDRAHLCVSILHCGTPRSKPESYESASIEFLSLLQMKTPDFQPAFFGFKSLTLKAEMTQRLDGASTEIYLKTTLLPHCLRLCTEGPEMLLEDLNRFAVGDSKLILSSIPDPCLPIAMHSEEAIQHAAVILRRARLARAARFIVGGGVSTEIIISVLRGNPLVLASVVGLPIWWCPWIHDLGLLACAAIHGLSCFTIRKRGDVDLLRKIPCFELTTLDKHIRSAFFDRRDDGTAPTLPPQLIESTSTKDMDAWIRVQAIQLPNPQLMERRLALICGEITEEAAEGAELEEKSEEAQDDLLFHRYFNIPMFDQGGCPR